MQGVINFLNYHNIPKGLPGADRYQSSKKLSVPLYGLLSSPEDFNNKYWEMSGLSENPNLSWSLIAQHPEGLNHELWDMYKLSRDPNLSWEFVSSHPDGLNGYQSWDMKGLSMNTSLSWNFVISHPKAINGTSWRMDDFKQLPFAQKEFKEQLKFTKKEIKYRPGNSEYMKCKHNFESAIIYIDKKVLAYLLDLSQNVE